MARSLTLPVCLVALWGLTASGPQAHATEVSGNQSGTWTLDGSPYLLVGDVVVPPGEFLAIEPGVVVRAQGHYKITVDQATLLALGTQQARILLTADETDTGWRGIRLETATDETTITYCILEYARGVGSSEEVRGGAIMVRECSPTVSNNLFRLNSSHNDTSNGCGGGVCAEGSSAVIVRNVFIDNSADYGGAIAAYDWGTPIIAGNVIIGNSTASGGGGIAVGTRTTAIVEENVVIGNHSDGWGGGGVYSETGYVFYLTFPTIRNNLIVFNTTTNEGGGIYCRYDRAIITNNVIAYNSAGETGGGMYVLDFPDAVPLVDNTIIWGNTAALGGDQVYLEPVTDSEVSIEYSNVQGGWPGVGNIDLEPFFVDPDGADDVPGTEDDNFRLLMDSPCINAGDPAFIPQPNETDLDSHPRVLCDRVDMGPYEFGIGDYNCDRSVDLTDFSYWIDCMTGPHSGPYTDDCLPFDFNYDNDVDLTDFAGFQDVCAGGNP